MSAALYTLDILRLAAATADYPRLASPDACAQRRATICGSTITIDLSFDVDGRVMAYGHEVRACALGQAAATIFARAVVGLSAAELTAARDSLALWLANADAPMPDWPQIDLLARARAYPARHGAIRLPFEAVVEAATTVST
jgi:NifU-like protein involved in Fe-S cluster formation